MKIEQAVSYGAHPYTHECQSYQTQYTDECQSYQTSDSQVPSLVRRGAYQDRGIVRCAEVLEGVTKAKEWVVVRSDMVT